MKSEQYPHSLRQAYLDVMSGVAECSERRYENSLVAVARMVNREIDSVFRAEVKLIAESMKMKGTTCNDEQS